MYSIKSYRPKENQTILYVGNLGIVKATYRNYESNKGIGWVLLDNGEVDCFDEWTPFVECLN